MTLTASLFRTCFADALDAVFRKEHVTVTYHGRPRAILVHPDFVRDALVALQAQGGSRWTEEGEQP